MKRIAIWGASAVLAVLLFGCDSESEPQAMPEVNNENCVEENVQKIQDEHLRQRFGSACLRRSSSQLSSARTWEPGTFGGER